MTQNRSPKRFIFFGLLLGFALIAIVAASWSSRDFSQDNPSLLPVLQLAGKLPQAASRTVSKLLPVDGLDEQALGEEIKRGFRNRRLSTEQTRTEQYLNDLINSSWRSRKPFRYEIFLIGDSSPNAFAMPGGVIGVTQGLLDTLNSESELVAVIAHEIGHIELSHSFDAVKYSLLSKKITHTDIGKAADFARNLLIKPAFSKTQEDEADEYAFAFVVASPYPPIALASSLQSLENAGGRGFRRGMNPLSAYLATHPDLDNRIRKFASEAKVWATKNPHEIRYIGRQNLKERKSLFSHDFGNEERTGG